MTPQKPPNSPTEARQDDRRPTDHTQPQNAIQGKYSTMTTAPTGRSEKDKKYQWGQVPEKPQKAIGSTKK